RTRRRTLQFRARSRTADYADAGGGQRLRHSGGGSGQTTNPEGGGGRGGGGFSTVAAEAVKLQTQSAERAWALDATQITQIPQKGRHFLSLLSLMPGVINNNNFEGPASGGIGSIRINGSRAGSLSVTTDGVPNMDTGNQQGPPTLPS